MRHANKAKERKLFMYIISRYLFRNHYYRETAGAQSSNQLLVHRADRAVALTGEYSSKDPHFTDLFGSNVYSSKIVLLMFNKSLIHNVYQSYPSHKHKEINGK